MADILTKEQRRKNMQNIRGKDTRPEELVRKYLFSKGYRYRKNDPKLPGKPDIVLPKYRTVIFVNGCFWHHHKGCRYFVWPQSNVDFWKAKINRNVERDKLNHQLLLDLGWNVIDIWECELKKDNFENGMENVLKTITDMNRKGNGEVNDSRNNR